MRISMSGIIASKVLYHVWISYDMQSYLITGCELCMNRVASEKTYDLSLL